MTAIVFLSGTVKPVMKDHCDEKAAKDEIQLLQ